MTEELALKQISALSDMWRTVPKFCTSVQCGVLDTGNVIMSLIYAEEGSAILIDRVIFDKNHAKALAKTFQEVADAIDSNG